MEMKPNNPSMGLTSSRIYIIKVQGDKQAYIDRHWLLVLLFVFLCTTRVAALCVYVLTMSLTVLSDDQVKAVLEDLTLDELDEFRHELSSALHEFSTGMNSEGGGEAYQQPHRITTKHPETCATTLYMPSCGPGGMGCKGESDSPLPPPQTRQLCARASSCDG
jgi:hypothetical protein